MREIKLNWKEMFSMNASSIVGELVQKYPNVFQSGLRTLQGTEARIHVDKDAKPIYCKACPVPYLLKAKIENKIQQLVDEGIIEPVQFGSTNSTNCERRRKRENTWRLQDDRK